MDLTAADALLCEFPLVEPFAASHGTTTARTVTIVRLVAGDAEGWGECSALPAATYTAESAAGCFESLTAELLPALLSDHAAPGADGAGADVGSVGGPPSLRRASPDAPMALAAIEMALLDLHLRIEGRSLGAHLGATRARVRAGVSLGLDTPDRVVERARTLVADGYRRLKVKIQPGHDGAVLDALRSDAIVERSGAEIQLDANGAYGPDDLDVLVDLARAGASALEQPLAPDHVDAAAELVGRLDDLATPTGRRPVPVVADEAVTTLDDADTLADRRAATGVSIKPARVGGLTVARDLHDLCRRRGLAATAGGMLETGLGRHALAALAGLPGFDLTGDLSPAGRWLAVDAWADLELVDGEIVVPTGPGVAPPPDRNVLDANTIDRREARR
ncbi:MAG: enolase C-terminal domain-like protein [Actinomycetota bacterium]